MKMRWIRLALHSSCSNDNIDKTKWKFCQQPIYAVATETFDII